MPEILRDSLCWFFDLLLNFTLLTNSSYNARMTGTVERYNEGWKLFDEAAKFGPDPCSAAGSSTHLIVSSEVVATTSGAGASASGPDSQTSHISEDSDSSSWSATSGTSDVDAVPKRLSRRKRRTFKAMAETVEAWNQVFERGYLDYDEDYFRRHVNKKYNNPDSDDDMFKIDGFASFDEKDFRRAIYHHEGYT